jgi:hypothetical protein
MQGNGMTTDPLAMEEFIRRLIVSARRPRYSVDSPGLPIGQIEEFFAAQFGYSCVETINRMLQQGGIVAARPTVTRNPPRMQRPELVDVVGADDAAKKHPILYLPDDLPNAVKRLWDTRERKRKILHKVLTDTKLSVAGGENVVVLANSKKKG